MTVEKTGMAQLEGGIAPFGIINGVLKVKRANSHTLKQLKLQTLKLIFYNHPAL